MTRRKDTLLVGGGGHCRSVIDVFEQAGLSIAGIIHGDTCRLEPVSGYPALGRDSDLAALRKEYDTAFVCVGQMTSPSIRKKVFALLTDLQFSLPKVISPLAHVSARAILLSGSIVMHQALVNSAVFIGHNCIINSRALVEHDCVVEDHCHIAVGAVLCGGVRIGEGAFVGAGAIVRENVSIGPGCIVGMGCQVRHDLAEGTRYVG